MRYAAASGLFQCGDVDTALTLTQSLCGNGDQRWPAKLVTRGRCEAACEKLLGCGRRIQRDLCPLAWNGRRRSAWRGWHCTSATQRRRRACGPNGDHQHENLCRAHELLLQTYIHSGQSSAALEFIETMPVSPDIHCVRHATEPFAN